MPSATAIDGIGGLGPGATRATIRRARRELSSARLRVPAYWGESEGHPRGEKGSGEEGGQATGAVEGVRSRIARDRDNGMTLAAIAEKLNWTNVPTAAGGKRCYPSTVAHVLRSVALDEELVAR